MLYAMRIPPVEEMLPTAFFQPLDLGSCMLCGKKVNGGQLWTIDKRHGLLCPKCERATKLKVMEEYRARASEIGILAAVSTLACRHMEIGATRRLGDSIDERLNLAEEIRTAACALKRSRIKWLVRQAPLGGGASRTVGTFETKDQACWFGGFWGSEVDMEVRVMKCPDGADPFAGALDFWEEVHMRTARHR
jgi:hypothetical protein